MIIATSAFALNEIGACHGCDSYNIEGPHQRDESGKVMISCQSSSGMVTARTDINSSDHCEINKKSSSG